MKLKLLGHSANDLFWFILPLVLPSLLTRYQLNYSEAGGILTVYLLFTAVGSITLGKISDRITRKKILSYGFYLAAAGLIASGFAPNLPVFILLISITAIGMSTFHPVMYAVIDETYTDNKSSIMGYYECCGTSAILLMFLINGYLISRIGIRGVLMVTAVPAVIMGTVYLLTDTIGNAPGQKKRQGQSSESIPQKEPRDLKRLVIFLITVILRIVAVSALLNFLPTIFVHFFGMEEGSASYATAFFFGGGIIGSIIAGKLSEKYSSYAIIMIGTIFTGVTMLILSGTLPIWVYIIVITLFGAFSSGCVINQNLLISRLSSGFGKGEIFGILMGVITVTSALSPALFGMVIDAFGYRQALYVFTVPLLLGTLVLAYLLKTDIGTVRPQAAPRL